MTHFVLVHGSGQRAASWSRVGDLLTDRGHVVAAPELAKDDLALRDHVEAIAAQVGDPDTVLVAHSLSGVFLPLVAELRPCALLVFVAAVVPEPGRSVREQLEADPSMFHRDWIAAGPRWSDPAAQQHLAEEFLFHDCDASTLPWALQTMRSMTTHALVTERSPLAAWPAVPGRAIVASGDRTLRPAWCRKRCLEVLGSEPVDIEAGHCPHVSRPHQVADLLEAFVGELAGAGDGGD